MQSPIIDQQCIRSRDGKKDQDQFCYTHVRIKPANDTLFNANARHCWPSILTRASRGSSGGHTGGASGAVHQGPRPLGPTSEDQIAGCPSVLLAPGPIHQFGRH